jgi:hypothetical protein
VEHDLAGWIAMVGNALADLPEQAIQRRQVVFDDAR